MSLDVMQLEWYCIYYGAYTQIQAIHALYVRDSSPRHCGSMFIPRAGASVVGYMQDNSSNRNSCYAVNA